VPVVEGKYKDLVVGGWYDRFTRQVWSLDFGDSSKQTAFIMHVELLAFIGSIV
jgi:hypothetical protein